MDVVLQGVVALGAVIVWNVAVVLVVTWRQRQRRHAQRERDVVQRAVLSAQAIWDIPAPQHRVQPSSQPAQTTTAVDEAA